MKKIIILFIFIVGVFSYFTQSCKKDVNKSITQNVANNSQNNLKISREDTIIQTLILNFMDRMDLVREDPDYDGAENWNYSEDSTIWYIEAALNFYFSYYCRYFNDEASFYSAIVDSSSTSIEDNGEGEYNIVQIQETWDYFTDNLVDFFN